MLSLGTCALVEGPAAGGDADIVTLAGAWTAAANASWLHTSSSGSGNGLATFTFDANTGPTRTGTLTIANQTLTVTQAGSGYVAAGPVTLASSGLSWPYGVAVAGTLYSGSAGNVYIADSLNSAIKEWNAATQTVSTLVSSGLSYPEGVAVDNSGNVYIADRDHDAIKEWNAATRQVSTLVSAGLSYPDGVAVDASGNVYIADMNNSAIKEWNVATQQVSTLVSAGLNYPEGVAVDGLGNVYIADSSNNAIKEWNAATQQVSTLVSAGLNSPEGVAVDESGNVYIADRGNNALKEWNAATQQVSTLVSSGLSQASGVAVDGSGNVFIADTSNNAIKELPRAFVPAAAISEDAAAGSDCLPAVAPASVPLTGLFAPASDQGWLTIGSVSGGVVSFSFTANTGVPRTAHITVLGQQIAVTQKALPAFSSLSGSTITYGTGTTTLSGSISLVPTDGSESVSITLNGVTQTGNVTTGGTFSSTFDTSKLTVGGSPYTITYTYAGDANLTPVSDTSKTVTVTPATPTLAVNPVNITYGTALTNGQLGGTVQWTVGSGTVNVPGAFAYTSAAGTVLSAGSGQTEAVTFTPTDNSDYTTVSSTATVNVAQAAATVTLNPVNITYGTALENSQLGGTVQWTVGGNTVSVPGALAYTSAAGTVPKAGNAQSMSVTFTPTDSANYAVVVSTVTVNVAQVTSAVVSVNPVNFTYGTALQSTQLSGTAQGTVNGSTVSVPGTFAYTSAAGTVLKAGSGQSEAVTFTPTDSTDFTTAASTVTVHVAQATPTVTVNPVNITYGTALANGQISGTVQWTVGTSTVNVPGTFSYVSAAGTVLNAGSGQSEAVTFTPTDTADYTAVASTVTVNVARAAATVAVNAVNIIYGTALTNGQLSGTAQWTVGTSAVNVPGTLAFTAAAGTVPGAGSGQSEAVTFTPTDGTDYTATASTVTLNVTKATPTVVTVNPVSTTYGTALANGQLTGTAQWTVNGSTVSVAGTLAYSSAAGTVLKAGNGQSEPVTFNPTDNTDYNTASSTVAVNVAQATPTVVTVNPVTITYGTALANGQLSGTIQWTVGGSTVSVAGTLAYTSAVGTVLDVGNGQTEAVTFTPTDATDYTTVASKATVTVTPAPGTLPANLGIFNAGYWYRDMNGDGVWDAGDGSPLAFGPPTGATAVVGDWDGSGKTEVGFYLNGTWYLDTTSGVEQFTFGFTGSDVIPVVGDWNGDGKTEVGVYANGAWFRDVDGSHTWDATNQAAVAYLGWSGASVIPVPGYWAGNGKTQMGVYCNGVWFLDSTGTGQYDGTYSYWGWSSPSSPLIPVVGNWNGGGTKSQFGVYSQGVWFRDADGTHAWDAANQAAVAYFGWAGAQPVVGNWLTYASGARAQSQPAAAAAVSDWPQAAAVPSVAGTTIQSAVRAWLGDHALTGDDTPTGNPRADDAPTAEFATASPAAQLAAINPLAVDRIDLGGLVERELGQLVGLRI